jgi:hypothetical protein
MTRTMKKRLDRLTQERGEKLRIVSVYPGDPMPTAEPGELLVVIRKFCAPESGRR